MLDAYYYQFLSFKEDYLSHVHNFKNSLSLIVTLGSFAIELGLKTLHIYRNQSKGKYCEKQIENEKNPWKTHSLYKLFNMQNGKDRDNIIKNMGASYQKEGIKDDLKKISNNFKEWRYYLEHDKLSTNLSFMTDFLEALDRTIQDIV